MADVTQEPVVETNPPVTEPNNEPKAKTYTEAELQAEVDRRVQQAVATNTQKVTEKVKNELKDYYAQEAKKNNDKSAEDRVKEIIEQHKAEMNERERKANVREAEVMLKQAGFSDDEIEYYTSDVTCDHDTSLAKISKACNFRKANNEAIQKSFEEKMASQFGRGLNGGNADNESTLQKAYDDARKNGNLAQMSAIQRTASEKNIQLKLY